MFSISGEARAFTAPVMLVFERHCIVNLDPSYEDGIPYVVTDKNFIERIL